MSWCKTKNSNKLWMLFLIYLLFCSPFFQMEDYLPKESGRYLKVILGNLNVSILDRDTKCNYKEQYEQFKLTINIIGIWDHINLIGIIIIYLHLNSTFGASKTFNLIFSATILAGLSLFMDNMILDRMYMFLVLWYYCTLTIRESILRVNGTRIKVSNFKMIIQFQRSIYYYGAFD